VCYSCLQTTVKYPYTVTRKNLTLPPTDPHVHITALEEHFWYHALCETKSFWKHIVLNKRNNNNSLTGTFSGKQRKVLFCSFLFELGLPSFVFWTHNTGPPSNTVQTTLYTALCFLYEIHRDTLYGNSRHSAKQSIHFVAVCRHHLVARENFIWFQRTRITNTPAYKRCPS